MASFCSFVKLSARWNLLTDGLWMLMFRPRAVLAEQRHQKEIQKTQCLSHECCKDQAGDQLAHQRTPPHDKAGMFAQEIHAISPRFLISSARSFEHFLRNPRTFVEFL
jgi:hypothetical protein